MDKIGPVFHKPDQRRRNAASVAEANVGRYVVVDAHNVVDRRLHVVFPEIWSCSTRLSEFAERYSSYTTK